ncbi:major facilitator superfamily protein [Sphingobium sp. SYK-6]|uniref:MFS transporter n=1 Tax=Sphingobium sp. (strain NBRC 103272 / SYK-6) TaxID=627192 RepID=UPI0002277172|nr:MFS transporter [Sphingobium sp. SYK-6]BAK67549.1 major facilitator superfamily protein [Sphingobium sp. SYK-6]
MNDIKSGRAHAPLSEAAMAPGAQPAWPPLRQAYYAAWVLAAVQMCAQLNNGVMSLLVEPVKRDLGLTDMQMSYLLGFSTVLFYVVIGIPAARLVDRHNRKWLTAGAVLVWSGATAACGFAQNFWQFFAARFGIGAGESINGPLAYSLMADYFPPEKLPRAIAIYNVGFTGGTAISLLLGALMIHILNGLPTVTLPLLGVVRDWQFVFILNGLVGIPIALLVASIAEPKRRGLSLAQPQSPGKSTHRAATLREVFAYFLLHWRIYGPIFLGLCFTSLHMFGMAAWGAVFYMRSYGWAPATVGLYSGLLSLALAVPSLLGAIWISDWFRNRGHADANMRVLAIGFSLSAPFMILGPLMPNPWLALAMGGIGSACMLFAAPSLNAAMQIVTPNEMRGQMTALYLFTMSAIGGGLGPTYMAFLTEHVWGDPMLLRYALATSAAILFPLSAVTYWSGMKPYGVRIRAMKAAGLPV